MDNKEIVPEKKEKAVLTEENKIIAANLLLTAVSAAAMAVSVALGLRGKKNRFKL